MEAKSIFKSKIFWANFIAIALIIIQALTGISPAEIGPERQGVILAVVNIIFRFVTKVPVNLKSILAIFIAGALIAGCASFESNTYKTMYTLGTAYDAAMKSAAELYQEDKLNSEQVQKIIDYANAYYVVYHEAVIAFEIYKATNSAQDKEKLIKVLAEVSKRQGEVIGYIDRLKK
ncbi:MAG: hypothetical protein QME78_13210 [Thermodesulfobacteriota bacterium]|nr:hypothetical protein [Thermodesulfobacteriota bacterium]